jgi:hypothetical protein
LDARLGISSEEGPQLPAHALFLKDALQMVPAEILAAWRVKGCGSGCRTISSDRSSSIGEGGNGGAGKKRELGWLQRMNDVHGWLMRARYLTSRGMGAAAQELLEVVVKYAR